MTTLTHTTTKTGATSHTKRRIDEAATSVDKDRRGAARGRLAGAFHGLRAATPVAIWAAVIRLATVLVDYALVLVTALTIIPMIGAYVHEQSGASLGELTSTGTIALWAMPFGFIVVVITVAEIAFMRWLWKVGSRRIARIKAARLGENTAANTADAPRGTKQSS